MRDNRRDKTHQRKNPITMAGFGLELLAFSLKYQAYFEPISRQISAYFQPFG